MVPARVLVAYWGGERAGEGIKEYTLDGYSSDGVILVEGGFVGGANTSGGANPTSGGANPSDGLSATLDRVDGIRRLTLHLPSSAGACSAEGFPAALALCEGAPTPMIAAIGVGAPWKSYHTERASLAIAGGGERVQVVKIPLSKLIVAHAALMLGAWLLLAPLGVGIARYLRPPRHAALSGGAAAGGWRFWFVAHRALQVLAALCTFAGVALAFAGTRRTHHYDHAHGRAGLGLLLLVLFQTLNGVFRPQKNKPSPPPKPEPVQLPMMSSRSSSARSRSSLASFAIFAHMSHFPWHTLHLAHVFTPDSLSLSLSLSLTTRAMSPINAPTSPRFSAGKGWNDANASILVGLLPPSPREYGQLCLRHFLDEGRELLRSNRRELWEFFHRLTGRVATILGFVTAVLGARLYEPALASAGYGGGWLETATLAALVFWLGNPP